MVAAPLTRDPPVTVDGVSVTAVRKIGRTASGSCFATPPNFAVTTPLVSARTASAVSVMLAALAPGATVDRRRHVNTGGRRRQRDARAGRRRAPVSVTLAVVV